MWVLYHSLFLCVSATDPGTDTVSTVDLSNGVRQMCCLMIGVLQLQFPEAEFISFCLIYFWFYAEPIVSSETMVSKNNIKPLFVWQQYL